MTRRWAGAALPGVPTVVAMATISQCPSCGAEAETDCRTRAGTERPRTPDARWPP